MDLRLNWRTCRAHVLRASLASLALSLVGSPAFAAGNYLEEFEDGQAQNWTLGAGWSVAGTPQTGGGRYLAGTSGATRTYATFAGNTWTTGYDYTVRLNSPTWPDASSRVGTVFNYQDSSNYYEVLVDPAGTVTLNRILNGVASPLASRQNFASALRSRQFTDVQVSRLGADVTVRVNGNVAVRQALVPTEVFTGRIGVVVENTTGHFDFTVVRTAVAPWGPSFPRIGTVRIATSNYTNPTVQAEIARAHIAILKYDTQSNLPIGQLASEIKQINPQTRVVLYTKMGVANLSGQEEPTEPAVHAKIVEMDWWLRNPAGKEMDGPYKPDLFKIVNVSRFTEPDASGLQYPRWFANWIADNYYAPHPAIDGIFMDSVYWEPPPGATPTPETAGDWNRDGLADPGTRADVRRWARRGFRDYFDQIGSRIPNDKLIFANVATWGETTAGNNAELAEYYGAVHGGTIEQAIVQGSTGSVEEWGGWARMMETYRKILSTMSGPRMAMFMQGLPATNTFQHMRYGLGSCLLEDGYYTPYMLATEYSTTPWFDEYGANLGYPTPAAPPIVAWQNGVWRRDFQNGIVLVNPKGNGPRTVTLETAYRRINGTQAPSVNNGQLATSITLQDRDGIVLLRQ